MQVFWRSVYVVGIISANILIKNKTKTPLLMYVLLYTEDITARNRPMFYVKTAAKEQAPKTGNLRPGGLTRNNVVN